MAIINYFSSWGATIKQKIIIDTDPGIDDTMAIFLSLNSPELDLLGLTTVYGNTSTDQGTINALRILEISSRQDIPVFGGADKPLKTQYTGKGQFVHGHDGQGNTNLDPPSTKAESGSAVDFLEKIIKENPGEIILVPIGPLTNIAELIRNNSDKLSKIKHCYIMGGSSNALGNVTKFAEYNFWVDPEAADIVLNSGIPITVIGWDPSLYDAMIDSDKIKEIDSIGTKYSTFTNDIQVVLREMMKDIFGTDSYDLPDPLAMAVYLDNDIISESVEVNVRVDTRDGMTRGGCVLDFLNLEPEAPKVRVVQRCHGDKFYSLLKQSLT